MLASFWYQDDHHDGPVSAIFGFKDQLPTEVMLEIFIQFSSSEYFINYVPC